MNLIDKDAKIGLWLPDTRPVKARTPVEQKAIDAIRTALTKLGFTA